MNILVTGGAGYIGSLTCVQLLAAGHTPILLDNLHNAKAAVVDRIAQISGTRPTFVRGDVRDRALLERLMREHSIDAVIHFAGLKAVGESVAQPLSYYDVNVHGTLVLLEAMRAAGVRTLVFSSSATVYAESDVMPLAEDAAKGPVNPYGRTKWMVEEILADAVQADPAWSLTALRYFNPVGAHPSGLMGEDPQGVPNNLMPFIAQVAVGRRERLSIFGDDYPTADGTGVRDYIHVMDLADGHVAALQHGHGRAGHHIFNLGNGQGISVRQMLSAFGLACGRDLPFTVAPRRAGDLAAYWADPTRAAQALGWRAHRDLAAMCADTWRWQSLNPLGYPEN
ncbi:UDP-glucose 4-epimerase GalE [Amphibiibacter pelophylacis]|uniref:UDP-glucose 4-epimerase GalE n=1 Tax=Amphibiibacter pelophylacis TaxID=1799477 RepID=A0ACC6NZ43_9BURK